MTPTRVLITGCSGGGKSTLISELVRRGHTPVAEPGRRVIAAERAAGGDGLPWINPRRFARACLAMATTDWSQAGPGLTFFDRGVVDAAVALRRLGEDAGAEVALQKCRYDRVIVAPPWRELFLADPDPDRRHGFPAAEMEYHAILDRLRGLELCADTLPKTNVVARADWLETLLRTR